MNRTIKIEYVTGNDEAVFTCPFCEQEQKAYFRAQIVHGRLSPDPMNLVRQHLFRAPRCPDHKKADYENRDLEEDYGILVRMDGLKITQTGRRRKSSDPLPTE